ncbi:MAG: 4Fe-4S dicluster domain-containing protein [Desulfosoma sp.]
MNAFLYVDFRRCTACFACEAACEAAHGTPSRLHLAFAEGLPAPLMCRHCQNSPCVVVCPEQALQWNESNGVVFLEDRCTRCGWCAVACPFGVLTVNPFEASGLLKCDLCSNRRRQGKQPACVLTCPTGAIRDDPDVALKQRRVSQNLATIMEPRTLSFGTKTRQAPR